jgi:glutamine amidotransferase-like uncharacterized protein
MRRTFAKIAVLSGCILATVGCDRHHVPLWSGDASILLFNGAGTSSGDVAAVEALLDKERLNYSTVNSVELDLMPESQLGKYRLLIVPGGNFMHIGEGLTSGATAKIRDSVGKGLNYLGICAGALFAGEFPNYNGLNLTSGVGFGFYSAEEKGIRKSAVPITYASGPTLDQYWEDGPELKGWGTVVAKYPDATPALVEGKYGNGWIILAGFHPEAPESWRSGMIFQTPASVDNEYAARLIRAALNREVLPHY